MAVLEESREFTEMCRICGQNNITVKGFMPQSFDQNQNTCQALDDMGIQYAIVDFSSVYAQDMKTMSGRTKSKATIYTLCP